MNIIISITIVEKFNLKYFFSSFSFKKKRKWLKKFIHFLQKFQNMLKNYVRNILALIAIIIGSYIYMQYFFDESNISELNIIYEQKFLIL